MIYRYDLTLKNVILIITKHTKRNNHAKRTLARINITIRKIIPQLVTSPITSLRLEERLHPSVPSYSNTRSRRRPR